jgi:hypothetical protein
MTVQEALGREVAAALKVSNPSLRYLGSYARFAIHPSEFSPELGVTIAKCGIARAIKLRKSRSVRYESCR